MIRIRWHVEVSHRWIHFCFYLVAGRVREFLGFGVEDRRKRALEKKQLRGISPGCHACCGSRKVGREGWAWNTGKTFMGEKKWPDILSASPSPYHSDLGVSFRKQTATVRGELEMLRTTIQKLWRPNDLMKRFAGLRIWRERVGETAKADMVLHAVCFQCCLQYY